MQQEYRDETVDGRVDEGRAYAAGKLSKKRNFVVRTPVNVVRIDGPIHEGPLRLVHISIELPQIEIKVKRDRAHGDHITTKR